MKTYPIEYGDRIYVRAMQDGLKVLEVMVTNVADLAALVGEIRYAGRRLEGLTQLFIRNHTRGWSMERPFKFYTGVPSPRTAVVREAVRAASVAYRRRVSPSGAYIAPTVRRTHVIFPWETH
ncbi:MAG: hypothetical protein K2F87_00900 [Muribaculaceae bacterium]|nr:hypothetical protein [Muribaculaceae bacterium]